MPKVSCCLCSRRVETNRARVRIGCASVWPLMEIHSVKMGLDLTKFSKGDILCMKCYSVISHYRMTDRGPNKKIKFSAAIDPNPIITRDVLRSAEKPIHSPTQLVGTEESSINVNIRSCSDESGTLSVVNEIYSSSTDSSPSLIEATENENNDEENYITTGQEPEQNTRLMLNMKSSEESSMNENIDSFSDEGGKLSVVDDFHSSSTGTSQNWMKRLLGSLLELTEDESNVDENYIITDQESEQNSTLPTFESSNDEISIIHNRSVLVMLNIKGIKSTQSKCSVCNSKTGRGTIPWPAIQQVWFEKNIYIPKTNRTCKEHIDDSKKFKEEALKLIEASEPNINVHNHDFAHWLHQISKLPKSMPYSLENDGIEAKRYEMFFGVNKENFGDLVQYLSGMRNTGARSIRSALAMFLMLLRNNMKQEVIAYNFSTTQQVVSQAIDSVSASLDEQFVPKNLGYYHMTHEEAVAKHSIKLTSNVLGKSESHLCVIADCTYNYIEKPSDFELQRKTFSAHKKRNLLKPLYIVFPSGYILEAAGPYFCDAKNNDAANIRHHYKNSDLLLFLEDDDYFIFDRGFRDVVDETTAQGQTVYMPSLLNGKRTHFECDEANASRKVTMNRWVIEAANGRIKNVFPFFKHTIEGTYVPKIMRFNRIACAVINKYFPPLIQNKEFHEIISDAVRNQTINVNELKEEIEHLGIQRMSARWVRASERTVVDFPKLTMDDLKRITLGSYQLKMAEKYTQQHMKNDSDFAIFVHRQTEEIIRAQIQSRFTKSKVHNTWVKFDQNQNGYNSIKGLYCSCKVGERTLGCCSHLASVVRYLGYDRHQPSPPVSRLRTAWDANDCDENNVESTSEDEEH